MNKLLSIGRNKAIAFKAVPTVLKYGKIVDYQTNWKNRGYDTAVFAAPITISGKEYYLAAVVIVENTKNSYYLHEVALQEKGDNAMFKTGTVENGTSSKALSPIETILQKLQSVNNQHMQNGEKNAQEMSLQALNSEYMKSAEAVTYDDDGNIIPLDKRFDKKKVDIRFSLKEVDRYTEKEYNKSRKKVSTYSEAETLFMQWKDSKSVSVGDTKAFVRFDKKIHFYEKTNDGCIEITKKDYDAKRVLEHEQDYESVERRIDVLSHKYGTVTKRGDSKSNDVYRNSGDDEGNDNSSERERFQNEQSGNLERSGADSKAPFKVKPSLQETSDAAKAREELLKVNDNLRVANTVLKNKI